MLRTAVVVEARDRNPQRLPPTCPNDDAHRSKRIPSLPFPAQYVMVAMFYHGSLQEGIALAVSQSKAVICFVRDDEQQSTVWENEYFADDDEFAQLLEANSITLRLTKDSQEAGFLTSFCPITKLPAVVVIKDGTLREYIIPDVSKESFRDRLGAVLKPADQVNPAQPLQTGAGNDIAAAPTASTSQPTTSAPPAPSQPQPEARTAASTTEAHRAGTQPVGNTRGPEQSPRQAKPAQSLPQKQQPLKEPENRSVSQTKQPDSKKNTEKRKETPETSTRKTVDTEPRPKPAPTPPKQYRLQVRLFDGSSVRSSFTPSQTIRRDVRPWLDEKMDEQRPYNLKHILTPLPNRTLTIADEEQTLEELNLGATANLVMVPIKSYTEAYTAPPSLPARAVNTAYDLASSAVGTATGLVGSFFGYGATPSSQDTPAAGSSASGGDAPGRTASARPAASRGPIIRTLHDQRREQGDSQLYNGNQLNFQPRGNPNQQ